jgi:hypothetical protein
VQAIGGKTPNLASTGRAPEKEYFSIAGVMVVSAELSYRVGQNFGGVPESPGTGAPFFPIHGFRPGLRGIAPPEGSSILAGYPGRSCALCLGLFASAVVLINVLL